MSQQRVKINKIFWEMSLETFEEYSKIVPALADAALEDPEGDETRMLLDDLQSLPGYPVNYIDAPGNVLTPRVRERISTVVL